MHHRRAHGLVDDLEAGLELVVLEEAEDAEEDGDEVDRELLARQVVHLLEDRLVLVGRDHDGVVEDLADDPDAQDDEDDEAHVVGSVQQLPVVEPLPEPQLDGGGNELAHVGPAEPEGPDHEDDLESEADKVTLGEVRLHVEGANVHLGAAVDLHCHRPRLGVVHPVHAGLVEGHADLGVGELAVVAVVEREPHAHRARVLVQPLELPQILDFLEVLLGTLGQGKEGAEAVVEVVVLKRALDRSRVALSGIFELGSVGVAKLGPLQRSEVISVREIRKLMRPVVLNRGVGSDEVGRETRRVEEPVHALAFFLLPALLHYQDPANEQVVLEEKSALVRRDGIPVVPL
mmetsp:Transcript_50991/g.120731  ORF Transcript_50991/g.120731 Transcript_50991/m.120731 type:complete len:346 (-) Transcript_50991:573-1610(-)